MHCSTKKKAGLGYTSVLHCQHCVGRNTFNRCLSQAPAALTLQPSLSSDSQCHTRGRLQKDTKKDQHCDTVSHYRYHTLSNSQYQSQCHTKEGRLQKDTALGGSVLSHYQTQEITANVTPWAELQTTGRHQDTETTTLPLSYCHTQETIPSVTSETE